MNAINFNDPEMQEIFEGFLVETQELVDSFSQDIMMMEEHGDDMDLLNRIFRSIHTIKGTSSFMGFDSITTIAHQAEDVLNKLRRGELLVTQRIVDVMLEVNDWIITLLNNMKNGVDLEVDYSATIAELEKIRSNQPSSSEPSESAETKIETPIVEKPKSGTSALDSVLGNKEMTSTPGDFTQEELDLLEAAFAEVNTKFFSDTGTEPTDFDDLIADNKKKQIPKPDKEIVETIQPEIIIEQPQQAQVPVVSPKPTESAPPAQQKQASSSTMKSSGGETIRVDVLRVEALMDLSGELVLGRNRLAQITEMMANDSVNPDRVRELIETTAQVDFITSEIQSAVMKMRMVPIGKLYQKAPRIVRDLSKEFGKKINLVLNGEETEIDRGIIEELNDPLVHMIRNSCDHGIESQEDRIKIGKHADGTIILDAYQEGNNIVMKISDDGKGMDPEKLKAKAIEKGIVTEDQAAMMSKREILQLVFLPGFSTAAKVSAVSGRGVGMDVVRTNIVKLKGMIEIDSEVGKGTTFIVKLPLTLAIIQGLLVRTQNEKYAIPLASVIEVVSVDQGSVYSMNQREVIRIREDVLPLVRLDKVLKSKITVDSLDNRYVVVVGVGTQRVGFVVDELLGQQEIVIKSLGEFLGQISGIAGSTILGDGSVIMIIDVPELVQQSYEA